MSFVNQANICLFFFYKRNYSYNPLVFDSWTITPRGLHEVSFFLLLLLFFLGLTGQQVMHAMQVHRLHPYLHPHLHQVNLCFALTHFFYQLKIVVCNHWYVTIITYRVAWLLLRPREKPLLPFVAWSQQL